MEQKEISVRQLMEKEDQLDSKYPIDAMYSSKCSLWTNGLRDGSITNDQYEAAKKYYGRLWNYVGD